MSTKQIEALKLALEALEDYVEEYGPHEKDSGAAYAITAIREALAHAPEVREQPAQEPPKWQGARFDSALHQQPAQQQQLDHTAAANAALRNAQNRSYQIARTAQQEPYGQVTVVRRPGCVDQHWFYRWPEPPYLDNAAECHTVYTSPQPSKPWAGLTDDEKAEIKKQANYNWETTAGEYASKVQALTEAKLREKNAQPSKPLTDAQITDHFQEHIDTGSLLSFADGVCFAEAAHGITGEQK